MVSEQLIQDYRAIIDQSNLYKSFLTVNDFSTEPDEYGDIIAFHCKVNMTLCGGNYTNLKLVTHATLVFNILDLYLGSRKMTSGSSFARRCLNLKVSKDSTDEAIIREYIYRILKIIRNAVVHDIASITDCEEGIQIEYNYKTVKVINGKKYIYNTPYELNISNENLKRTIQLAYYFSIGGSEIQQDFSDAYIRGVLAKIYYDLLRDVSFVDDIEHAVFPLHSTLRIAEGRRDRNIDSAFIIVSDALQIRKIVHDYVETAKIDYLINFNGYNYAIPFEALDNDNEILLVELDKWKISSNA